MRRGRQKNLLFFSILLEVEEEEAKWHHNFLMKEKWENIRKFIIHGCGGRDGGSVGVMSRYLIILILMKYLWGFKLWRKLKFLIESSLTYEWPPLLLARCFPLLFPYRSAWEMLMTTKSENFRSETSFYHFISILTNVCLPEITEQSWERRKTYRHNKSKAL